MARIALASTRATREHIGIFDEQPVIMAAVSDPDVMRHIRHSVLGGLDSMLEDERAVLLDTLETWLDTGGSSDAAAAALFCHPNTIRTGCGGSKPPLVADCALPGTSRTCASRSPQSAFPHADRRIANQRSRRPCAECHSERRPGQSGGRWRTYRISSTSAPWYTTS